MGRVSDRIGLENPWVRFWNRTRVAVGPFLELSPGRTIPRGVGVFREKRNATPAFGSGRVSSVAVSRFSTPAFVDRGGGREEPMFLVHLIRSQMRLMIFAALLNDTTFRLKGAPAH